jgi:hypothetical protein
MRRTGDTPAFFFSLKLTIGEIIDQLFRDLTNKWRG